MINFNELRIGNWVLEAGEPSQIVNLDRGGLTFYRINDILVHKETGRTKEMHEDRFNPINLTEDILAKCGFVNNGSDYWYLNTFPLEWNGEKLELVGTNNLTNDAARVHIKHLHQLQNLYQLLSGKEIELDLYK